MIIDAAKRRQLPAWIRDGLEKMEREKQRALEKERQLTDAVAKKQREDSEKQTANDVKYDEMSDPATVTKSRFVCVLLYNGTICLVVKCGAVFKQILTDLMLVQYCVTSC